MYSDVPEVRERIHRPEDPAPKKAPDQGYILLRHFMTRHEQVHGYPYKPDRAKDASIFRAYAARYGADALPVMDFLFDRHAGLYTDGSKPPRVQGPQLFCKGSSWLCDQLRDEYYKSQEADAALERNGGMMGLDELLGRTG